MIDFEKYKTQISLPDFLVEHFNFKPAKGNCRSYPKLIDPDTGQTIVIRKNSLGHYTYFDIGNDRIKGKTILDIVQSKLSVIYPNGKIPSLPAVSRYLDNYLKTGKPVLPDKSNYSVYKETLSKEFINTKELGLQPLYNFTFLLNRSLSEETIKSNIFYPILFNRLYHDENSNQDYLNTAFKMVSLKGFSSISQRNERFKGCIGFRGDSLCASNFDPSKKTDFIFIAESFIDCMSHYQIYSNLFKDKNILYFSSEGSLAEGQEALIQKSISHINPENIVLLFDNDKKGLYYSSKLLGNLCLPEHFFYNSLNTISYKNNLINTQINVYDCRAQLMLNKDQDISSSTLLYIESIIQNTNNSLENIYSENPPFQLEKIYEDNKLTRIDISFDPTYENFSALSLSILDIKFNCVENLNILHPFTKDFNDDLRCILGLHKDWKLQINNDVQPPCFSVLFKGHFHNSLPIDHFNNTNYKDLINDRFDLSFHNNNNKELTL